jgi:UDP-N-acetylmuramoylalanine--D-glutamate ligase
LDPLDFKGKKVLVLGAGLSGVASAKLLCSLGAEVVITDDKSQTELPASMEALKATKVGWAHPKDAKGSKYYALIVSPGAPIDHPVTEDFRNSGVPVIGELELAYLCQDLPILAVTGSNGKTTVAGMTHHMLSKMGYKSRLCGNIGDPFSSLSLELRGENPPKYDVVVAEVSSFQLETVNMFRAKGAALLNLSPDHLDRHKNMEEYLRLKRRIYQNQDEGDFAIINEDDPLVAAETTKGKRFGFSRKIRPGFGAYVVRGGESAGNQDPEGDAFLGQDSQGQASPNQDSPNQASPNQDSQGQDSPNQDSITHEGKDLIRIKDGEKILAEASWGDYSMKGSHNQENLMAAAGLCLAFGADPQKALEAAMDFKVSDHRLERVGTFGGADYYDDSKGTNVGAVMTALSNFKRSSVILIMGGRDKDMDFKLLRPLAGEKVRILILMGESKERIRGALKGTTSMVDAEDMEGAVRIAAKEARPGDTVLLSPACASFDMFKNYKERGEVFQREVKKAFRAEEKEAFQKVMKAEPRE